EREALQQLAVRDVVVPRRDQVAELTVQMIGLPTGHCRPPPDEAAAGRPALRRPRCCLPSVEPTRGPRGTRCREQNRAVIRAAVRDGRGRTGPRASGRRREPRRPAPAAPPAPPALPPVPGPGPPAGRAGAPPAAGRPPAPAAAPPRGGGPRRSACRRAVPAGPPPPRRPAGPAPAVTPRAPR